MFIHWLLNCLLFCLCLNILITLHFCFQNNIWWLLETLTPTPDSRHLRKLAKNHNSNGAPQPSSSSIQLEDIINSSTGFKSPSTFTLQYPIFRLGFSNQEETLKSKCL
ncbi:hypothetical protein BDN71DRAFT_1433213 [Pleurotus eryngii]|uniref:Uncharacterized protein n=1 Tax=Pleurotus eryngii TaxID=5323 RepID=A0A9P6DEE6_PLEER|nr:hypothetical protein BDN71DRAFT_1433213 [Pleurotus eryngii]